MEKKKWTPRRSLLVLGLAAVVLALLLLVVFRFWPKEAAPEIYTGNPQTPVQHPVSIDPNLQNMGQAQTPEQAKQSEISGFTDRDLGETKLRNGLEIIRGGSYTGAFVEDGSNAPCSDVLALVVTNTSNRFLEWAELALSVGEETAYFRISSLPAGQSLLVMERSAMTYDPAAAYGQTVLLNSTEGEKDFSLHTERFSITAADHVVNLQNLSPEEISGNIAIFYKNVVDGLYLGGITYTKTLTSGVAGGGIAQFICENYTVAGSELVFIVYEQ